jgi:hypothetical protein
MPSAPAENGTIAHTPNKRLRKIAATPYRVQKFMPRLTSVGYRFVSHAVRTGLRAERPSVGSACSQDITVINGAEKMPRDVPYLVEG